MSDVETNRPPATGDEVEQKSSRHTSAETRLRLFNPSPYPRGGVVATPWAPIAAKTGAAPGEVLLKDAAGRVLNSQIDEIDGDDRSCATLVFRLEEGLVPRSEHYTESSGFVTLHWATKGESAQPRSSAAHLAPNEIALDNGRLAVKIALSDSHRPWLAGSATSVRLDGFEVLDCWRGTELSRHDPEKRCLQVDQVRLYRPPWDDAGWQEVGLCGKPYRLVSRSSGPVRSSVTIASSPLEYRYDDPSDGAKRTLNCELHRVFSLDAGADYLLEEACVKGTGTKSKPPPHLRFTMRYFAWMDMSFEPTVFRYANVPDWFAFGSTYFPPYPGYGFATDVHASEVAHPHPGYPDAAKAHSTFSWELRPSLRARCLHLFMAGAQQDFEHRAGHFWYELLYKPLRAEIED
jgi:hypothetical protein